MYRIRHIVPPRRGRTVLARLMAALSCRRRKRDLEGGCFIGCRTGSRAAPGDGVVVFTRNKIEVDTFFAGGSARRGRGSTLLAPDRANSVLAADVPPGI